MKNVIHRLLSAVALLSLLMSFIGCTKKQYSTNISPFEITEAVEEDIAVCNGYILYPEEDMKYIFDDTLPVKSQAIIHSPFGDNIGEVGVLLAKDSSDAKRLYDAAERRIERIKEEKELFLKNYLPSELKKLEDASAERLGNYVIYTVLPRAEGSKVINLAKDKLE